MRRIVAGVVVVVAVTVSQLIAQESAPRRVLIVADASSLQFRSTPWTRWLLSRTLRVLRSNGDLVGMAVTGTSGIVLPLPASWDALDSSVARVRGEALHPWTIATAAATSDEAAELRRRSAAVAATAADALRSMSAAGASAPVVLLFTEGYPSLADESDAFVDEARRLNATVFVIDPRGLSSPARQFDQKEWEMYLGVTESRVRTLASATKGTVVSTRSAVNSFFSSLAKDPQSVQFVVDPDVARAPK